MMHIRMLVEDSSGEKLLHCLVPKLLGPQGQPHTWRIHSYKGVGRIPKNLGSKADPTKRILLDQLPRLLRGFGKTPGIDAVVVLLDSDDRDCNKFLAELKAVAEGIEPACRTMFRLAIEEMEAWYLGDRAALLKAFPRAKKAVLASYTQDAVCGTWELLADAVQTGGATVSKKAGWRSVGQIKHDWAEKIGPYMALDQNASPSFCRFRDGLRRLASSDQEPAVHPTFTA
jgi:Domain of unknown function (DUF4276)